MSTHEINTAGARHLGRALREMRRARNWTLVDFEKASQGRIKAVVLGSYERGSRSVSVDKLQAIAEIYAVPIGAFFSQSSIENSTPEVPNIVIDLRRLREELTLNRIKELSILDQFCCGIINFRRDWNGEVLSLRINDVIFLAIMSGNSTQTLLKILANKKVLFNFRD